MMVPSSVHLSLVAVIYSATHGGAALSLTIRSQGVFRHMVTYAPIPRLPEGDNPWSSYPSSGRRRMNRRRRRSASVGPNES
jgi:hypothetical protein